jgi:hypothetical protein
VPIPPSKGPHEPPEGRTIRRFQGVSRYRDTSDAQSLHEAIQAAAEAAVEELGMQAGDFRDFEIARIQVRIGGNPNVKIYSVELTDAG